MTTLYAPHYLEAVDPNLQPVASQALHWVHRDGHTTELHQARPKPHLDGCGRPLTRLLAVIRFDPKSGLWFGYVHAEPGLATTPPDRHVCSRYGLPLAQEDIIGFLRDAKQL